MRRSSGSVKWPLSIGCSVILLLSVGIISFLAINLRSTPIPPAPTMPSPNAYDFYMEAGNSLKKPRDIDAAYEQLVRPEHPNYTIDPDEHRFTLADREQLVRSNAQTLAKLREGFRHKCMHPSEDSWDSEHPEYKRFHQMARLLYLDSQNGCERREWAEAVNDSLDAVHLGTDICRGAAILPMLVGTAVQRTGITSARTALDHLTAEEAKLATKRLEHILTQSATYADTLVAEKRSGLRYIASFGNPRNESRPSGQSRDDEASSVSLLTLIARWSAPKYSRYMDELIQWAHRPCAARCPKPEVPKNMFTEILTPHVDETRLASVKSDVIRRFLLLDLAIRAYCLEHGGYPNSLSALAPEYLKRIPDDPFALKGPLLYKRTGDEYILCSVGPDGKDDGGKPIDDPQRPQRELAKRSSPPPPGPHKPKADPEDQYRVFEDSKGDIVAGVNR